MVPALAVTDTDHRLGYGRGFYDVTLPDFCPPALSVVVAFDFQLLAELPVLEHDVACEVVVTDARVIRAGKSGTDPDTVQSCPKQITIGAGGRLQEESGEAGAAWPQVTIDARLSAPQPKTRTLPGTETQNKNTSAPKPK